MFLVAVYTLLLVQNQECNFPNSGRHGYCWTLHTHEHTATHSHARTRTHTHTPHKQQKSEHVKGKKFVIVWIKTFGVNRQSEFRWYVLILNLC